jgi:hypothetical protein
MSAKLEMNGVGANTLRTLTLLLSVAWPYAACAEADGPDFYRIKDVAAGDTLAIRSAPTPAPPNWATSRPMGRASAIWAAGAA